MERVWSTSRRGFSVRSIFMFVLTVFITVLLWATFGNQTHSYALDNGEVPTTPVNWNNDSLLYGGHRFFPAPQATAGESHRLPVGTNYYVYVQEPATGGPRLPKAHVIYFAPGADPPTATSATYVTYDYSGRVFSNPQSTRTIEVTIKGQESSLAASSCSVDGIGWIICPVSVFLATGMDFIFDLVKGFLEVQPTVLGDPNNDLYTAWNVVRSVANVAFIIVFLIIIYSQLTSIGISNYGLKKLLPRLIIAAILVNLSFFITALAVDISNILGYSVQDIFVQIRQDTFNITNDTWSDETTAWADVTGFILSGGAVVGGIAAFSIATAGAGGAIYLLLPLLLGLTLTVLFVLLVLAARQAIIIILIVIAPLAFVAYLLPNTEEWFKKWRELFMTMLIFFPAFSLVFGGSQLAGGIIIQNATNIFTMVFGLAVQVAPLVITPLLLRLSGGLLGKIAGIVNDPRKGLMDRTRNWSKERAEMHRLKSMAKPTGLNPFRGVAKSVDNGNRRVKERTGIYTTMNDSRYNQTAGHKKIHEQAYSAENEKKRVEQILERDLRNKVRNNPGLLGRELETRVRTDEATEAGAMLDETYESFKSGKNPILAARYSALSADATKVTQSIALTAIRSQSAKREQVSQLRTNLKANTQQINGQFLREYSGGVEGFIGAQRALAQAISEQHRAHTEVIANANAILDDYNLDAGENLSIAKAVSVKGVTITDDIREAAVKRVGSNGVITHINELLTSLDLSPAGNEDFRVALVDALKGNSGRPKYVGMGLLDQITQGIPGGVTADTIDGWIESMLIDGKLSARELATQDKDTLARINNALPRLKALVTRSPSEQVLFNNALNNMRQEVTNFRGDKDLVNMAAERNSTIDDIERNL